MTIFPKVKSSEHVWPEPVVLSEVTKVEKPEEPCQQDLLDSADDEAIRLSETAMPIIPLVSYFW